MNCLVLNSAAHLKGLQVGPPHDSGTYPSGEIRIRVPIELAEQSVFVVASVLPDANSLLEILLTADALKRMKARVNIVVPHLAYARQDKPKAGEGSGARVVCKALHKCGFARAYVVDVHSAMLRRTFRFENVLPYDVFHKALLGIEDSVVVAPDSGGVARAKAVAKRLGKPLVCIGKERPGPGQVKVRHLKGEVRSRDAVIVDDMIDTGGTVIEAADLLREKGVRDVYAFATHGIFSGDALGRLGESIIKKIFVTTTLPVAPASEQIEVLDIEPLLRTIVSGKAWG